MPEWWKLDLLARVEAGARFAKQATRALLLVPVLMVCILSTALGSMPHNQAPAAVIGVLIVLALAAVQVVAHFIAVDRVSRLPLDPKRASRLRLANTIRIVTVAVLAGAWMMEVADLWMSTLWQVTLYFGAPIAFAVADTMALRAFRSLPRELGWRDSGWTQFASASSVVLIPVMGVFMLVPFLGWLIAPVIWIIALAEGFRALERFACIAPTRL